MTKAQQNMCLAATTPGNCTSLVAPTLEAKKAQLTPEERAEIELAVQRIKRFPKELGWLMVYVGILGIALPGVVGLPLLVAGGTVLAPKGRDLLSRWVARNPGRFVRASLKQIVRLADDIERRYPSVPGATS
jgi:hypothetical protein